MKFSPDMISKALKRGLDVLISFVLIILLSPFLLCISMCIRIKMGSPIFFKQNRPGLHGTPFQMIKFRTMDYEPENQNSSGNQAVTSLGAMLRRWSLDELPELWNVLKGDMSLVGPRPLLLEYLPLYSIEQARRHLMKPGVTGWAQINGRNALSWPEKFKLDVWYVDHWYFRLDIKILTSTLIKVLTKEGISADGHTTMPPFTGTSKARSQEVPARIDSVNSQDPGH